MADIERDFENQHLKNLASYQKEVEAEYIRTIEEIFQAAAIYSFTQEVFRLDKNPNLKNRIEELLRTFRNRVFGIITRAIGNEYRLSDTKAGKVLEEAYGAINPLIKERFATTDPKKVAEFIEGHTARLKLSDRVWKLTYQLQAEIEQTLFTGIKNGKAAKGLATQMKQYLREPDKLFRRVRNTKGRLVLSENAKRYKPGAGIYRSSYRNALRLTATETNAAYRTADQNRWAATPFVLGYEVALSRNHKTYDVCDRLAGLYPNSFKWEHWHPNCICSCRPVLSSPEQYDKYEDAILNGTAENFKFEGKIKDVPPQFKVYVAENMERMEGWRRLPFWLTDNRRFIKQD